MSRPHLLIFVAEDWYFCSHRLSLARAAISDGFRVTVMTRVGSHGAEIRDAGVGLVPISLQRGGINPLREAATQHRVRSAYRHLKPDIVHNVALKPIIHGSLAANAEAIPGVVNAVAGLGAAFSADSSRTRAIRPILTTALRHALTVQDNVLICQNEADLSFLNAIGATRRARVLITPGSGVDLNQFLPTPLPAGEPVVMFASRLLRTKGVTEFLQAAESLQAEGVAARFVLVGEPDPENPSSLTIEEYGAIKNSRFVESWGWQTDMPAVLSRAAIVVLPSYSEGTPKVLLEAAASGRPIVATDIPGCRQVVEDGVNGLLVPPKDQQALADAIRQLLHAPELRRRMGASGRSRAIALFDVNEVNRQTLSVYQAILGNYA